MKTEKDATSLFKDSLYHETVTQIGTLRAKLPEEVFANLAREVIRRLTDHPAVLSSSIAFPTDSKIDELARALLLPNPRAGIAFVERIRDQGASVETVYLAYLAEAAKRLGYWWETDQIGFTDVTIGTGHIYAIMRGLKPVFGQNARPAQPSALFCPVPGETHTLGIQMAADMARKQGWNITLKRDLSHDALISHVISAGHSVIGMTAAGEHSLPALARIILALRISAPNAAILISGNAARIAPETITLMGPDAVEPDFDKAMTRLGEIWEDGNRASETG
ncbi:cobalamin-dependent protein [Sulfitobacter sp. HNIBRBA3233]|uniref:cobalamin B12-binding domain-containing protein n=1 Tax=Sulfitobacter marinivivus TaxID=3158558 RepID=UPI0032DFBB42